MRLGVAAFVGLLAFIPSLVSLIMLGTGATLGAIASWLVPFALWLAAWWLPRHRATMMIGALAILLTAMVFVPVPEGFIWPRLSGVALALAVTTATLSRVVPSVLASIYAVALLSIDYVREQPQAGHLSPTLLDAAGTTALGLIVLATAIAIVARTWDQVCRNADAASNASRTAHMQSLMAERSASARAAVDRRIHETVLNTLAAIARGRTSAEFARTQCAQDLQALDSLDSNAPRGVGDMVLRLLTRAEVPGPVIPVVSSDVRFRDSDAASVAFAALGEVLRNVTRHARATTTTVRVRALQSKVLITVTDNGIGMDDSARQRFGMRRALSESVEAIGGSVAIRSAAGRGTEVALTLPHAAPRPTPPQPGSAFDVLLSPISVRMSMLSVAALGLFFIVPVSAMFTTPWLLVGTYLLLVATVTTISFLWDRPMVGALGWLSLALVLACQTIAWTTQQGCVSSPGLHLMVFSAAGALLLPILAQRSVVQGSVMLLVVIASTIALPWVLPEACQTEVLIPAVEEAAWLIALIGIIAVLTRAVDRSSARDAVRWGEIAQATARRLASDVVQQRWQSVDGPTRELLTAVAAGEASPDDPGVRGEAAHLESRLRSLLETSKIASERRRDSIDDVIKRVSADGASISVLVLDSGSDTQIPEDVVETVLAVAAHSAGTALHLTLLDEELLVAAGREALQAAGCGDLDDTEDPRMAITSLRWSVDVQTG